MRVACSAEFHISIFPSQEAGLASGKLWRSIYCVLIFNTTPVLRESMLAVITFGNRFADGYLRGPIKFTNVFDGFSLLLSL
jgi:hypothetical protein